MDITCAFFSDARDRWPHNATYSWDNLCARLAQHLAGPKDGPALACATFAPGMPRANANVAMRAMVALDIELNKVTGEIPDAPQNVIDRLAATRQAAMVW